VEANEARKGEKAIKSGLTTPEACARWLLKKGDRLAPIRMTKNEQFLSYYEKTAGEISFKINQLL
jgi:hypothetical protein